MTLKNVVILNDFGFVNGGISQVSIASAVGLSKLGLSVHYFCAVEPVDDRLCEAGVSVWSLHSHDILGNPNRFDAAISGIWNNRAAKALRDYLATMSPSETIVHIHGWPKALSASVFKAIRDLGFRYILTLHDYFTACPNGGFYNYQKKSVCEKGALSVSCILENCDARSYPQKVWRVARQFFARDVANIVRDIDHVIYISELSKKVLSPYFTDRTSWHFCRNPVGIEKQPRVTAETNEKYVFIGRLSPEKGADLFAEAIKISGAIGCIVGSGEMLSELRERYTNIQFYGWQDVSGINHILNSARALIFSSRWYETLGLTALEALSRGVPVIVADNTSAAELVRSRVTGLHFKTSSLESLVSSIHELADSSLVERMSISAFETYWRDPPTLEEHVNRLTVIYESLLCGQGTH